MRAQFRVIVVIDPPTHKQTGPRYNALRCSFASAQCKYNRPYTIVLKLYTLQPTLSTHYYQADFWTTVISYARANSTDVISLQPMTNNHNKINIGALTSNTIYPKLLLYTSFKIHMLAHSDIILNKKCVFCVFFLIPIYLTSCHSKNVAKQFDRLNPSFQTLANLQKNSN